MSKAVKVANLHVGDEEIIELSEAGRQFLSKNSEDRFWRGRNTVLLLQVLNSEEGSIPYADLDDYCRAAIPAAEEMRLVVYHNKPSSETLVALAKYQEKLVERIERLGLEVRSEIRELNKPDVPSTGKEGSYKVTQKALSDSGLGYDEVNKILGLMFPGGNKHG